MPGGFRREVDTWHGTGCQLDTVGIAAAADGQADPQGDPEGRQGRPTRLWGVAGNDYDRMQVAVTGMAARRRGYPVGGAGPFSLVGVAAITLTGTPLPSGRGEPRRSTASRPRRQSRQLRAGASMRSSTIEAAWGRVPLTATDAAAIPMTGFFPAG